MLHIPVTQILPHNWLYSSSILKNAEYWNMDSFWEGISGTIIPQWMRHHTFQNWNTACRQDDLSHGTDNGRQPC